MAWISVPGIYNGSLSLFGGFRWQLNSQDIALNKSNITIQMYCGRSTSGSGIWNTDTQVSYIEFDGGNRRNISTRYDFRNATIGSIYYVGTDIAVFPLGAVYTFDVIHNPDGTRTVPVKTFFNGNNSPYLIDITTEATITLPTIARASQPRLDAPSKDFGQTLTIYTDKASPAFTHTITYAFGGSSGTIATGVVDSTVWVVPTSLGSQIPTAISGSGTITCDTYNGATLIGTKTVPITLTVPASWRAVLTSAHSGFSWANSPAQLTGYVIQNISSLTLTLAAALNSLVSAYGTTITGYQVRFDTYNSGEVTYSNAAVNKATGLIVVSGTQYAYFKVKDARGYWSNEVQEQIMGTGSTIYPYGTPANNGFNVARNATVPTTADYQMNFGRSTVNGANTWNYQRQYWNGSAWVNVDASVVSIPADTITSVLTHSLPYVEANVYQVRVKLTDLFSTVYYEDTLPTSAVPFAMSAKGAGAGKIPTNSVYDFEVGARGMSSDGPINGVVDRMMWKMYTSHVIFDASAGTSPTGTAVNQTNPNGEVWRAGLPTLMGWNGANTFGVRVDSARAADVVGGYTVAQIIAAALLAMHPIGSIYITVDVNANPATLFGGTWVTFANGRTLVGWYSADADFNAAEKYGGEKVVTLTPAQIPSISTNIYTSSTGGSIGGGALTYASTRSGSAYSSTNTQGLSHNNMPPYMVVYMWKRTA